MTLTLRARSRSHSSVTFLTWWQNRDANDAPSVTDAVTATGATTVTIEANATIVRPTRAPNPRPLKLPSRRSWPERSGTSVPAVRPSVTATVVVVEARVLVVAK